MIRIFRIVEISLVAADAVCRGSLILAANVTLRAFEAGVSSGERKARSRMVELRACPADRAMALLTSGRETGFHVVRILGG